MNLIMKAFYVAEWWLLYWINREKKMKTFPTQTNWKIIIKRCFMETQYAPCIKVWRGGEGDKVYKICRVNQFFMFEVKYVKGANLGLQVWQFSKKVNRCLTGLMITKCNVWLVNFFQISAQLDDAEVKNFHQMVLQIINNFQTLLIH